MDHPVNVICFLSSRVSKDNKRYDINVETIPAKFAPQKKVSHSYVADDYVKSIKLVLNKTMVSQKPSKQVSSNSIQEKKPSDTRIFGHNQSV